MTFQTDTDDVTLRHNSYRPADPLAARNVESMLRAWHAEPTNTRRRLLDIVGIGQDRGRRTSSVVLAVLASRYMPRGFELASFVVDHATGAVTNGHYYENDGFIDAWNLFALRTLAFAPPRRAERHACGAVMVSAADVASHTCEYL